MTDATMRLIRLLDLRQGLARVVYEQLGLRLLQSLRNEVDLEIERLIGPEREEEEQP